MLKMYQKHAHSGSSVELWEENWEATQFNQSLQFCLVDPLRPLFEKYAPPGSLMLEGGCGMGQFVTFYTLRGVRVIGLDFAQRALHRLNDRIPDLPLCAGDVSALPFADESFDLYYSGGVVEHFEGGAEASLNEARRVLKKDGVLLISVPYFSPLRRLLRPLKKDYWKKVDRAETQPGAGDLNFFQYAYKPFEFEAMLDRAGLRAIEKQGYSVIWGLYELPFFGGRSEVQSGEKAAPPEPEKEAIVLPDVGRPVRSSLVKRLVVSEDATVPVLGLGVRLMRWAAANMMMYVCRRK
ncbi:MAG: class I SAM-dependent methyltransferase [Acidobacteria bacterium]|nr:class I SAM-dependent methyltransferase [Acidobacteriota bacterium]